MRNRSFATLGILALLAASSAFGQDSLRVDVPFEFHVADAVMPAGLYYVGPSDRSTHNLLSLSCFDCESQAVTLTSPVGGGSDVATEGRLMFNKYGETYFLSEVWVPGSSYGRSLFKSRTEREIARTTPQAHVTVPAQAVHVTIARR